MFLSVAVCISSETLYWSVLSESFLFDPDDGSLLLLHPPVPPRCLGPSLPRAWPAASSWTPTTEPESSEARDVGAGADGAGAAAPGGPGPPKRAGKHGEPVRPLPHPAAGSYLHRSARWEWELPHCMIDSPVMNLICDIGNFDLNVLQQAHMKGGKVALSLVSEWKRAVIVSQGQCLSRKWFESGLWSAPRKFCFTNPKSNLC